MGRHKKLSTQILLKRRTTKTRPARSLSKQHYKALQNSYQHELDQENPDIFKLRHLQAELKLHRPVKPARDQRQLYGPIRRSRDMVKNRQDKFYTRMYPVSSQVQLNTGATCHKCGFAVAVDVTQCILACTNCGITRKIIVDKHHNTDLKPLMDKVSTQIISFCSQFLSSFPKLPKSLINHMYMSYQCIHFPYKTKVYSSRTQTFLKSYKQHNFMYKRACERISKLLRHDHIPVLKKHDIMRIYRQRRLIETLTSSNDHANVNYIAYIRQLGRLNNVEVTRLFHNAKTQKIHLKQCNIIENQLKEVQCRYNDTQNSFNWKLLPYC